MALYKEIEYKGAFFAYWKIAETRFDYMNSIAYIKVYCYADEDTRRSDPQAYIFERNYSYNFGESSNLYEPDRAELYDYLKTLPEFENSYDY